MFVLVRDARCGSRPETLSRGPDSVDMLSAAAVNVAAIGSCF